MPISDIPILRMLHTRMLWHQERQRLLAENVANADTPRFKPSDLAPLRFEQRMAALDAPLALTRTQGGHVAGLPGGAAFRPNQTSFAVRPSGNAVDLEEEMLKVGANQMDYQAVTTLYRRSLNLLKTALGKR